MELTVLDAPFGVDAGGNPNPPHETQGVILDWVRKVCEGWRPGSGGVPILYVQGGWRSGKTSGMLAAIERLCQDYPGLHVLIARKDFNDLRLSTMVSWDSCRPRELVEEFDKQEHREKWVNGSQVFFRELKDLEGLGGQEFGLILVSEPYELEDGVLLRLKGRLSQKGMPLMLLMEGNPPNQGHWLHKMVEGDDHTAPDPDVTFIPLSTDENWGNLPDAYRKSIETAPASWQKKYRLGQWGFTPDGQPVYDLFKEPIHVRPVNQIPDRPVIRSWDSGARHPACLWAQTASTGQLIITHEWLGMEIGLSTFAPGVIQRTNEYYGQRMVMDVGDPAMFARSPQTGKSDAQVLFELAGIQLKGRQSTHQDRKQLIDGRLSLLINGAPAVLIHPRCTTLIEGLLGGYHYPQRNQSQPFGMRHQIPHKDGFYEHLANCFEYLLINLYGTGNTLTAEFIARKRARAANRIARQQGTVVF